MRIETSSRVNGSTGDVVVVEEEAATIIKIVVTREVEETGDNSDILDRITTNFAPLLVERVVGDRTSLHQTMIIGAQEKTGTVVMMGMNTTHQGEVDMGGREEEGRVDVATMTTMVLT